MENKVKDIIIKALEEAGYEFTRLLPPPKGSGFPSAKPKGVYL